MKKKIIITNKNRDGSKVWFEHIEDNIYTIKASKEYILEYASENYDTLPEDAEDYDTIYHMPDGKNIKALIHSFDPSGGPYISVGCNINGYKILRIFEKDEIPGVLFKLQKID